MLWKVDFSMTILYVQFSFSRLPKDCKGQCQYNAKVTPVTVIAPFPRMWARIVILNKLKWEAWAILSEFSSMECSVIKDCPRLRRIQKEGQEWNGWPISQITAIPLTLSTKHERLVIQCLP